MITGIVPVTGPTGAAAAAATKTSCRAVVHIGDSTSEGMILPDLPAQPPAADPGPVPPMSASRR